MSTFDERKTPAAAMPFGYTATMLLTQTADTLGGEFPVTAFEMGSIRRSDVENAWDPLIGDLDVVVTSREGGEFVTGFDDVAVPGFMSATAKKAHGWLEAHECFHEDGWPMPTGRMMVDAWWCPWESIGPFAFFLTGPWELNIWMRQRTNDVGLMLTQYGLFEPVSKPTKTYPDRRVTGTRVDTPTLPEVTNVVTAEAAFWAEWCQAVGVDRPFPWPWERGEVMRWEQGPNRVTRSGEMTPD